MNTINDLLRQSEGSTGTGTGTGTETETPRQLLTRQQLAEVLGTTDAKIRRYAEADTTNEYFGGIAGLGKGVRYPAESVALFQDALTLTPALFHQRVLVARAARGLATNGTLSLSSSPFRDTAETERLIETIRAGFAQSVREAPIQVCITGYPDKWLTLKEARAETGLTISEIQSVPALQSSEKGRRRWRRSDLHKLIETMGAKIV